MFYCSNCLVFFPDWRFFPLSTDSGQCSNNIIDTEGTGAVQVLYTTANDSGSGFFCTIHIHFSISGWRGGGGRVVPSGGSSVCYMAKTHKIKTYKPSNSHVQSVKTRGVKLLAREPNNQHTSVLIFTIIATK